MWGGAPPLGRTPLRPTPPSGDKTKFGFCPRNAPFLFREKMKTSDYLKILTEEIHSAVVATLDKNGRPVTRCIDMMLYDENNVYFLTAKGKNFYEELMSQKYISLSAIKGKLCISLSGAVENIGSEKLDEIFEKNPYMKKIYPGDTRNALEVFKFTDAEGNFFDITNPSHVTRGFFTLGKADSESEKIKSGYFVKNGCTGCGKCYSACPQKCISFVKHKSGTENNAVRIEKSRAPEKAVIDQNRCLHCGRCVPVCPVKAIKKIG